MATAPRYRWWPLLALTWLPTFRNPGATPSIHKMPTMAPGCLRRISDWATRRVFGARQAPDEVLRTFGSRMTRAIALDELLLHLLRTLLLLLALLLHLL